MDSRLYSLLHGYRAFLAHVLCLAALLSAPACGDDPVDSGNEPSETDDDEADDDDADDDDDDAPADDDVGDDDTGDDDEDDGPAIDGGTGPVRNDAGRIDAGRVDGGRSDAGGDAGSSSTTGDAALSPLDGSLGLDASASDAATPDARVDAAVDGGRPPRTDLGKGDGSDVVLMGDSWMSNTLGTGNAITGALTRLTRQSYREHARQGVEVLQNNLLFGPAIPTQWDDAVRADRDIKTVIMSGGGNDIIQNASLQADCAEGGSRCAAKLDEIGRALVALWTKMGAAGVQDVVHVLYSKNVGTVKNVDQNNESLKKTCADLTVIRCHTVDTDELVRGREDLIADGIHPTRATNDRIAKAISDLLVAEGIRR